MTQNEILTWCGIFVCVLHSAMFSGLNLALFGISRLRLEIEVTGGNADAKRISDLRQDSNFLLSSVLWGNVAINCLLTLLSESVLAGVGGFVFSTVIITFLGEIFPQAYFSRNALRVGAMLTPVLRFYQKLLYVVAKPTAIVLDWWLGKEGIEYFRETELRTVIRKHADSAEADLGRYEGIGALNFFALDDLTAREEGEVVDPTSVISLPVNVDLPVIPAYTKSSDDQFISAVQASGRKWVILTNENDHPLLVLDADGFLRSLLLRDQSVNPYTYCHRPVIVQDGSMPLGRVIRKLYVRSDDVEDDVIDHDLILLWSDEKRVITGADLLGRLLRGIVPKKT